MKHVFLLATTIALTGFFSSHAEADSNGAQCKMLRCNTNPACAQQCEVQEKKNVKSFCAKHKYKRTARWNLRWRICQQACRNWIARKKRNVTRNLIQCTKNCISRTCQNKNRYGNPVPKYWHCGPVDIACHAQRGRAYGGCILSDKRSWRARCLRRMVKVKNKCQVKCGRKKKKCCKRYTHKGTQRWCTACKY
ncbi:MAG: hypothetical protein EP343_34245 [Deltaproteobacteria bacterium]|nr:MAG: hypothetical protein EP343_34245 [Deltaproteobacteria bacterium]